MKQRKLLWDFLQLNEQYLISVLVQWNFSSHAGLGKHFVILMFLTKMQMQCAFQLQMKFFPLIIWEQLTIPYTRENENIFWKLDKFIIICCFFQHIYFLLEKTKSVLCNIYIFWCKNDMASIICEYFSFFFYRFMYL